jgi:hypothetical protein
VNNFFRRNQKKLLAVFAAGLMIVFILPNTCGQRTQEREDPVVAYVGEEKVHASQLGAARADWEMLRRIPVRSPRVAQQLGQPWYQPIPYAYELGATLATEIEQTPELFLLLQKDADRAGIKVAPDRVDSAMRELNISPNISAEEKERWRRAIESFLRVKSLHDRVTSNVKVSEPVIAHQLANTAQEVKLNLVEFTAGGPTNGPATAPATPPTTAPTTQELEAFFQKYASRPSGLRRSSDPNASGLAFGYLRPDRVKLQYVSIRKDQVSEAVRKSKEPYEWEVAARKYYLTHQQEFPVTQPAATQSSTTQSTTQATRPATSTAPTTRPFEEVREDVLKRVMGPEVEKLTAQVRDAIVARMTADWEKQRPQTRPTSGPASQPTGYGSFAYLEQLAADIQKQFGVLPAVTSKSDQWLSSDELAQLPGIGTARRRSGDSFVNNILQSAEPLMPVPEKADASAVLSLLEPSQPLEDFEGNVYLFRLTDAQRAHAPAGLAEVREQVEADFRAARAFDKAVADAKQFMEAAKKDGVARAAAAAGRQVVTTGAIGRGMYGLPPTTIPNYPASAPSIRAVAGQAYQLLTQASPDSPHPTALVELPDEKKVVVAELADVTSLIPAEQAPLIRAEVGYRLAFDQAQDLAAEYFTADAVKSRLGYRSLEDRPRKDAKDGTRTASTTM